MFVVFDLDGTLADDHHRQHHLTDGPKDWDAYHAECGRDPVIAPIAEIFRAMRDAGGHVRENRVEIWTGRSETVRRITRRWLANHFLDMSMIRMRPEGDHRPAKDLKASWVAEHGKPDLVFDNSAHMAEWWRSIGVACADVAGDPY